MYYIIIIIISSVTKTDFIQCRQNLVVEYKFNKLNYQNLTPKCFKMYKIYTFTSQFKLLCQKRKMPSSHQKNKEMVKCLFQERGTVLNNINI